MADPTENLEATDASLEVEERPAGEAGTGAEAALRTEDATPDAEVTGDKAVPYERFRTVNERAKAYAKYGKPEELAAKLARLDEYEAARARIEQEEAERQAREGYDPAAAERAARFRQLADEAYGPGYSASAARQRQLEEMAEQRHGQDGIETLKSLLAEHGLPTDEELVADFEDRMTSVFNKPENAELNRAYWNPATQREAIREAFTVAKGAHNRVLMAAGAMKLDDLAARRAKSSSNGRATSAPEPVAREFTPKSKPGSPEYETEYRAYADKEFDRVYDELVAGRA